MSREISFDNLMELSNRDYSDYISNLLNEADAIYIFDQLDDYLQKVVELKSVNVERICKLNAEVISTFMATESLNHILAYNFNTYLISLIYQNNFAEAKTIFLEGITFCQKIKHYEAGKSLAQNSFQLFASTKTPQDERLFFLARIKDFYIALDKFQDCIESLCTAAHHFADASAFQSAYRTIHDAQEIVRTYIDTPKAQILILETQGMVALAEGDNDCADIDFQNCFKIYKLIEEIPPLHLKANAALVKFRKNDYKTAKEIYESLLLFCNSETNDIHQSQIKINLLLCYRELSESKAAIDLIKQIEIDLVKDDIDFRVEAQLILAKTYFHFNNNELANSQLKKACIDIQSQIDNFQRLHYRRGIRERYVPRIKSMLININPTGNVEEIIHALVICFSNSLLDWLSVLDWADYVNRLEIIPTSNKEELNNKINNLINFGTPFLYGFREKYDDPFEQTGSEIVTKVGEDIAKALDYSLPWREFNDLTTEICQKYSLTLPFESSKIQHSVETLSYSLQSKSAFLFSFATGKSCALIFICENKYIKEEFPLDNFWQFYKTLYDYQRGLINRVDFINELNTLQNIITPYVHSFINSFLNCSISEFIFVPDHLTECLPILPILLNNDKVRLLIKDLNFKFWTCSALTEELTKPDYKGNGVFISNSKEGLELAISEKKIVEKTINDQTLYEIDLNDEKIDFSETSLKNCSLLHLTTHSVPANIFTDPMFVSTTTETSKNGIWLESVQRVVDKLNFIVVMLNGCNTGTTSNNNYFKSFLTNEKVGLTSIFILNRKCTVIATQWNEPETIAYIFSSLFYKRLTINRDPINSFILALVDLYDLTKIDAIKLLEDIDDDNLRVQKQNLINQSKSDFPFRNAYFLGMFQCFNLLLRSNSNKTIDIHYDSSNSK